MLVHNNDRQIGKGETRESLKRLEFKNVFNWHDFKLDFLVLDHG
jgi:hypothetical protein